MYSCPYNLLPFSYVSVFTVAFFLPFNVIDASQHLNSSTVQYRVKLIFNDHQLENPAGMLILETFQSRIQGLQNGYGNGIPMCCKQ